MYVKKTNIMNDLTLKLILLPTFSGTFFYLLNKPHTFVYAQVTPDGTTSTTIETDGSNDFTINNGDVAGDNLFHSFGEFSVPTNGSAFFNNADNITNIFSRVTGGNISNIDGLIGANGTANLFLINPAGIIFGQNSSLNIGGSFYGTTANSILFSDGELSALDTDNPPLLTINAPIGLNFRDNPADIQLQGANLALQPNQTLAFLGGNLDIQGGAIESPSGSIQLSGVATAGTISLEENFNFTIPENITRADISISDGTFVNVGAESGGTISVKGKNITTRGADMFAGVFTALATAESEGGTIEIDATESVTLTDGTIVDSSSFGMGSAGDISINAEESITFDNQTRLFSTSATAQGQAGNVEISTNTFTLDNNSLISALTQGAGDSGNIDITANSVFFNNASFITNGTLGLGDAGDINLQIQSLALSGGSEVLSSTLGEGSAGDIQVNATESILISGIAPAEILIGTTGEPFVGGFSSGLISSAEAGATGQGGTISVTTSELSISDGGVLSGRTKSTASGGNIIVNADTLDIIGGGQILTAAFNEGSAGSITLNVANQINISGSDPTFDSRREQVIELTNQINTGQFLDLEQAIDPISPESGIFASTGSNSTGSAGNIFIRGVTTESGNLSLPGLSLTDSGRIAVNSGGEGDGGNLSIQGNSLALADNAAILAGTPQGQGGNISLDIQDNLTLRNESLISALATGNANGGNINIDTDFVIAFPDGNNDIIANAVSGNGGNITIDAQAIFGIAERRLNSSTNDINASSDFGLDGNVSINTPDVDAIQGATDLPNNVLEPEQTTAQACRRDRNTEIESGLTIEGQGGIPPEPGRPLESHSILVNGQTNTTFSIPAPIETALGKIQPARGVKIAENGDIILTAYRTDNSGNRLPETRKC